MQVSLWVSTNNAATFTVVQMPFDVKERSYGILHTAEQACFIIVRGGSVNANYGLLYLSDESGTSMALSLENIHYQRGRTAEIVKAQGMDGVYLVNTVLRDTDSLPVGDAGNSRTRLQTKITFDKGSTWQELTPPKTDSKGKQYSCHTNCALHLFFKGNAKAYNGPYSVSSGTGLLLAVGAVASYLTEDLEPDEVATFFSRDAGN